MSKVITIDHPLVQHKLSLLRDKDTGSKAFRELVYELAMLMAYEVTRDLELKTIEIETPICRTTVQTLANEKIAVIPILRAGLGMADGIGSATAFKHGHQREDVVQVLARDFSDIAATAWFQFDQAFGGENLERFAQWRAGDAVLFGELLLVDPGARRQFVRKDPLSQSFGDFLVKRGRCNSGHGGVKVGMARSVR